MGGHRRDCDLIHDVGVLMKKKNRDCINIAYCAEYSHASVPRYRRLINQGWYVRSDLIKGTSVGKRRRSWDANAVEHYRKKKGRKIPVDNHPYYIRKKGRFIFICKRSL